MHEEKDFLVLGAGLAGLSAGSILGDRALVLEREDRPGGLVRTDLIDGYWFDRVLHILHFQDSATEKRVKEILGSVLKPAPPEAWVETEFGTARFPIQMHLGALEEKVALQCVRDLTKAAREPNDRTPENFEEVLLRSFGEALCDVFLFPYNRKVWKRPLSTLAPTGFQWTITPPDLEMVMKGAVSEHSDFKAYNSNGWYPRPSLKSPLRGMEVLSAALARECSDIRLSHRIANVDLDKRTVTALSKNGKVSFKYRHGCISTLPLPQLLKMCDGVPPKIKRACEKLTHNRVLSVAFCIRGERPSGRGHWRYYADESVIFNRLVYMHEFDPRSAPPDGWGLLVEITEPAEHPPTRSVDLVSRIRTDLERVGALPVGSEIINVNVAVADPAYVVFTVGSEPVVQEAISFLVANGITPLGRYGKWEYSSMAQVMRDGFACGETLLGETDPR